MNEMNLWQWISAHGFTIRALFPPCLSSEPRQVEMEIHFVLDEEEYRRLSPLLPDGLVAYIRQLTYITRDGIHADAPEM